MRIVVVGDGKVGYTLSEQLSTEGHDIVVIDNRIKALQNSTNSLDVMTVEGNGASHTVQLEAGVDKADLLIAATGTDEVNLISCIVAKKLGAKHTIARVRNPEYMAQLDFMKEELGLSMSVNPELAAANEMSRILRSPSARTIETFAKGRVELVGIKLHQGNHLIGQQLNSLYAKYKIKVLVCAVQRREKVYIPTGDFVLQEGDKIHITAESKQINAFFRAMGVSQHKIRNVMIIGGSRTAFYLGRMLCQSGIQVKIIEQDQRRCLQLSSLLPQATIVQGDGTDQDVLHEEGILSTDGFVALTGIDEENIIISMYASKKGVKKTITKVDRTAFGEILEDSGIESVISPKQITANRIVQYVRAMQNSVGSNVETLYKIVDNQAEALEFRVRGNANFIGKPLRDLKLKPNVLIAVINRGHQIIIPNGNDVIEMDDSVIVVTTNRHFKDLNDILA